MTMQAKANLKQRTLMIEASSCIGCQSCLAACKLENDLPSGPRPIAAIQVGPVESDKGLLTQHWPAPCYHCDQPACVLACPTGAMQKRADGLVFSDFELLRCIK